MRIPMLAALLSLGLSPLAASLAGTSIAPKTAEIHAKIAVCRKQATAKKLTGKDRVAYLKACAAKP
jgi:psiF repeat